MKVKESAHDGLLSVVRDQLRRNRKMKGEPVAAGGSAAGGGSRGEDDLVQERTMAKYPADNLDDFYSRYGSVPKDREWSEAEEIYGHEEDAKDTFVPGSKEEAEWESRKARRRARADSIRHAENPLVTGSAFGSPLKEKEGE